jgi:hypothetical protein
LQSTWLEKKFEDHRLIEFNRIGGYLLICRKARRSNFNTKLIVGEDNTDESRDCGQESPNLQQKFYSALTKDHRDPPGWHVLRSMELASPLLQLQDFGTSLWKTGHDISLRGRLKGA